MKIKIISSIVIICMLFGLFIFDTITKMRNEKIIEQKVYQTINADYLIKTKVAQTITAVAEIPSPTMSEQDKLSYIKISGSQTASAISDFCPTAIPSSSITSTPIPSRVHDLDWEWKKIDLYDLKIMVPMGWMFTEENIRPEQKGFEIYGHNCADYYLVKPDGSQALIIKPTCGFSDGAGDLCPANTKLTSIVDENRLIVRYYEPENLRFIYTDATTVFDMRDTFRTDIICSSPPIVVLEKQGILIFMSIEYKMAEAFKEGVDNMKIIDEVVKSISFDN